MRQLPVCGLFQLPSPPPLPPSPTIFLAVKRKMPFFRRLGRKVKTFFGGKTVVDQPQSMDRKDDQAESTSRQESGAGEGCAAASDPSTAKRPPIHGLKQSATTTPASYMASPLAKPQRSEPSDKVHKAPTPPRITDHREVEVNLQRVPPHPLASPLSGPSLSSPTLPTHPHLQATPPAPPAVLHGANHFPNAHDFSISNLSINHNSHYAPAKTVFEILDPYISHGAAHDSEERCDAPRFITYGDEGQPPKKLMWLGGPAGSGKTAIAGSVAETCKQRGLLAASFFFSSFSGSADRRWKRCVVTTIASHLAGIPVLYEYKAQLLLSIESNPAIFKKRLAEQAQCLLIEPLREAQSRCDISAWPRGIVLDALDEVQAVQHHDVAREDLARTDKDEQLEILQVLLSLVTNPAFPFRIFVASRPEEVINEFFVTTAQASTVQLFLDSKYNPDADVERFLKSRFAGIRRRYGISDPSWPGQKVIKQIVEMSSGQFIVPATIVRYVESGLPRRQLEDVMRVKWDDASRKNPFAVVDALYSHIFHRSPDPLLAVKWIQCITLYGSRRAGGGEHKPVPAFVWRRILEDAEGELNYILMPLTSLLSIPPAGERDSPIAIYHKSLTDFLLSNVRCGDLYVDVSVCKTFAAERCVTVLQTSEWDGYRDSPLTQTLCTPFLGSLDVKSKAVLASCDVAWWAHHLLTADVAVVRVVLNGDVTLFRYLGGICCGIHHNFCRPTESGLGTSDCHPACAHWREGVIAEAKALGWCVHRFEQMDVSRLSTLRWKEFDGIFMMIGVQRPDGGSVLSCDICQPSSSCTRGK
ncbi:hypothetical protein NMY22_g5549 [Coprinellus aureogranulatus]|nr:hypothetical protein NMY22_g5549 [Coprinellus aureogranulatus]